MCFSQGWLDTKHPNSWSLSPGTRLSRIPTWIQTANPINWAMFLDSSFSTPFVGVLVRPTNRTQTESMPQQRATKIGPVALGYQHLCEKNITPPPQCTGLSKRFIPNRGMSAMPPGDFYCPCIGFVMIINIMTHFLDRKHVFGSGNTFYRWWILFRRHKGVLSR
jgi:hypothetical protein